MSLESIVLSIELRALSWVCSRLYAHGYLLKTQDSRLGTSKDMAFPVRPVFTPFVVVVGGKYFLPVPGCLLFGQEILLQQETIFYCA